MRRCRVKLRIKGNSIRLRLGRSEVLRLATDGMVEESTDFGPVGGQRFGYALRATLGEPCVIARFAEGRVVVTVPAGAVHQWAWTPEVSIRAVQRTWDGTELVILIEKDLECLDAPNDEPQEDAFPHPGLRGACRIEGPA
jgi:hypothetical protein